MENEEKKIRILKIVEENLNLPTNDIKKELKKYIPNITNEQAIELIIEVNKRNRKNSIKNNRNQKVQKEDIER